MQVIAKSNLGLWRRRMVGRPRLWWEDLWKTRAGAYWWDVLGILKPRQVADHIIASPDNKNGGRSASLPSCPILPRT